MKSQLRTTQPIFSVSLLRLSAASLGSLVLLLIAFGVTPMTSLRVALVVALQAFSGLVTWRMLDRNANSVLLLGMGIGVGTAASVLSGVVFHLITGLQWGWLIPPLVAVVSLVVLRTRGAIQLVGPSNTRCGSWTLGAVVVGCGLGIATLAFNLRNYPLTWSGSWSDYHPDMAFFEALSTSIAVFGPLDSIFVPDGAIRYHWMAYAWAGQVTSAAGAEPFVVLTRLLPIVVVIASTCLVVGWTKRLTPVVWTPVLAAATFMIGGNLGSVYGGVLTTDSPSQSLSVMWALAICVAALGVLQATKRDAVPILAIVGVLFFVTMAAKVSTASPVLAGMLLLGVVGLVRRPQWWKRAAAVAVVGVAFVGLSFALIVFGASGGGGIELWSLIDRPSSQLGMNPTVGGLGVVLGTLILAASIVARWAGIAWSFVDRRTRWEPFTAIGLGMVAASVASVLAFNGFNALWFGSAASGPLSVLSSVGATAAVVYVSGSSRSRQLRTLGAAIIFGFMIFAIVGLLWGTGASGGNVWVSTNRWLGPLVGIVLALFFGYVASLLLRRRRQIQTGVALTVVILTFSTTIGRLLGANSDTLGVLDNGARNEWFSSFAPWPLQDRDLIDPWTDEMLDAARWLRDEANEKDRLATNVVFDPLVPALTRLQSWAAGTRYQVPYGREGIEATLSTHETDSLTFIDSPSPASVRPLCEGDVRWIWVDLDRTQNRDWSPYAEVVYSNSDVTILEVSTEKCAM